MSNITENKLRIGNFTSSEIYRLFESKRVCDTYIAEKNIERRMGLSLKQEVYSRPMAWGEIIEIWVHEKELGISYTPSGTETFAHPDFDYWAGSPDFICESKQLIAECKGYERKNFSVYADAIMSNDLNRLREDCPSEFWQLVSNATILGMDYIQPILFMPYLSQLPDIRMFAENINIEDPARFKYICDSQDCQLAYLLDGGYYKNFVTNIYKVEDSLKNELTDKVRLAGTYLKEFHVIAG